MPERRTPPEHFERHPDGSLTLGIHHAVQIGTFLGHKNNQAYLTNALKDFDVAAEGPTFVSRGTFRRVIDDALQRSQPDVVAPPPGSRKIIAKRKIGDAVPDEQAADMLRFIKQRMLQCGIESSQNASYRENLKARVMALVEALKTLNDTYNIQMNSQRPPPVIGPGIGRLSRFFPEKKPRDDIGAGARPEELEIGDALIRDARAELEARAAELSNNGIRLPKAQADALLDAENIIFDFLAEKIFTAAGANDARTVTDLVHTASNMGMDTEYIKTLDPSRSP